MRVVNNSGQLLVLTGGGGGGGTFSAGLSTLGNTLGDTGVVTARLVLAGGNNITLSGSTNGGSATVTISAGAGGGGTTFSAGASNLGNTLGDTGIVTNRLVFAGINGITLSQSTAAGGSATLTISGITQSSQAAINALGVSDTGNTAGDTGTSSGITWVLAGSNANTLSQSTVGGGPNTIWIQGPVSATTISAVSAANVIGTRGSRFALEDHQHAGVFSAGASNVGSTAGNTTVVPGRFVFAGSGAVTVSQETAANSLNTLHIQGPVSATTVSQVTTANVVGTRGTRFAVEDHQHIGVAALAAGSQTGNTAGNTASQPGGTWVIAGSSPITISGSTGAAGVHTAWIQNSQSNQQLTLFATSNTTQSSTGTTNASSIIVAGAGNVSVGITNGSILISGAPHKVFYLGLPEDPWRTNFTISNASFSLQHFNPRANITATQANLLMALSGSSNSTGALTISLGIYTMSVSTLSLASSDSRQITWTSGTTTSNSSVFGGVSGTRYRTVSLGNWSISAGDYMIGVWFRTTNNGTWRAFGWQGPSIVGAVDANETNVYLPGFSTSSFTTAMPASINLTATEYVRTSGNALQQPGMIFLGTF